MRWLLLFLVLVPSISYATVDEDFDGYVADWICCLSDCSVTPGNPPGFTGFKSNADYLADCTSRVHMDAARNSGGANDRGFRIKLMDTSPSPDRDSYLTDGFGETYSKLYFSWYMRESAIELLTGYDKLFRIWVGAFQIIPEWDMSGGELTMNLWNATDGNQYFDTSWHAYDEVTNDAWHHYEVMIDLDNDAAEFWFDGVSVGTLSSQSYPASDFTYYNLGGNSDGHNWSDPAFETRDYDNLIIAETYQGPEAGGSASENFIGITSMPGVTME